VAMSKQLPLLDFHRSNAAQFVELNGWLLPAHFGNSAAEYVAVRSAVGLMDLSYRGLLQVTGPDRLSFLQGMLSNDLRILQPFAGQHARLLPHPGKRRPPVGVL